MTRDRGGSPALRRPGCPIVPLVTQSEVVGVSERDEAERDDCNGHAVTPDFMPGDVRLRVDLRHYRRTEAESLLGDPSKTFDVLGWSHRTAFSELVREERQYAPRSLSTAGTVWNSSLMSQLRLHPVTYM
jgi:hypothetical protein